MAVLAIPHASRHMTRSFKKLLTINGDSSVAQAVRRGRMAVSNAFRLYWPRTASFIHWILPAMETSLRGCIAPRRRKIVGIPPSSLVIKTFPFHPAISWLGPGGNMGMFQLFSPGKLQRTETQGRLRLRRQMPVHLSIPLHSIKIHLSQ